MLQCYISNFRGQLGVRLDYWANLVFLSRISIESIMRSKITLIAFFSSKRKQLLTCGFLSFFLWDFALARGTARMYVRNIWFVAYYFVLDWDIVFVSLGIKGLMSQVQMYSDGCLAFSVLPFLRGRRGVWSIGVHILHQSCGCCARLSYTRTWFLCTVHQLCCVSFERLSFEMGLSFVYGALHLVFF